MTKIVIFLIPKLFSFKYFFFKLKIKSFIFQYCFFFYNKFYLIFSVFAKVCQIAGVLNNHIITMDNEIIKIDDLQDIKILK